jgi:hypothetical protein
MGYGTWTAVCPRCNTQNGSNSPCSNCGRGPVLLENYNWGGSRLKRYRCQTCHVIYNNTLCSNCGCDIGAVGNRPPIFRLIKYAAIALVVYWLWTSFHDSSSSSNNGYAPPAGEVNVVVLASPTNVLTDQDHRGAALLPPT